MRVPWTARRSNQPILEEINPGISSEGMMLKLKLQYFGHLILCHPFSSCSQSFPASESFPMSQLLRIRWPKYWSFSFSIIPSEEHPGLISFRMDWLDLLAVQGTLKSLQHHSSLQSCLILCDPMNCNLPGSSVHGILQARILEWVAISSSK